MCSPIGFRLESLLRATDVRGMRRCCPTSTAISRDVASRRPLVAALTLRARDPQSKRQLIKLNGKYAAIEASAPATAAGVDEELLVLQSSLVQCGHDLIGPDCDLVG
jgi:hypothetical protein